MDETESGHEDSEFGEDPLLGRDLVAAQNNLALQETKAVSRWRVTVVAVLLLATVIVSLSVYFNTQRAEVADMHLAFEDASIKLTDGFHVKLRQQLIAINSLAVDAGSFARTLNASWPAVTIPDFEERSAGTRELVGAMSIMLLPLVYGGPPKDKNTRELWEDYAVKHYEEWMGNNDDGNSSKAGNLPQGAGRLVHSSPRGAVDEIVRESRRSLSSTISPRIFDQTGPVMGPGPFAPLWQTSPLSMPGLADWVNFDLLSLPAFSGGIRAVLATKLAVVGEVAAASASDNISRVLLSNASSKSGTEFLIDGKEPISPLLYPVVRSRSDSSVVAILASMTRWRFYFVDILAPSAKGLIAVVRNECGLNFTFQIDGADCTFLGFGDEHHANFHAMHRTTGLVNFTYNGMPANYESPPLDVDYCPYALHVYPSEAMQQAFITDKPLVYAIGVCLIFLLATCAFAAYDVFVERRLKVVMDDALQSSAIISSLFPQQVRDRLFRRNSNNTDTRRNSIVTVGTNATDTRRASIATDVGPIDSEDHCQEDNNSVVLFEPAKARLRSYLNRDDEAAYHNGIHDRPIADLFPNCTVLFADICGFTAWSSLRDPAQVFTLLEGVYSSFDKIARKRGVFKVETVGDTYVAVTGLPDPQEDHAATMCRFARDCRKKMHEVTQKLELTLGPDTGDLSMRFGLHSGPVTAGVLRGEKSRFQLFGDTVNTAARMESTGERDRIQMSQATADLLRATGKGHWIRAREELVHAKGKGSMQTYWLETSNSRRSIGMESTSSCDSMSTASRGKSTLWGSDEELPEDDPDKCHQNKHQRLLDYNVDLLSHLLKHVVARRKVLELSGEQPDEDPPVLHGFSTEVSTVLSEVTEVIKLPSFNPHNFKIRVDPESIELEPPVMAQLKRYTTIVAAMYRSNPFHNFEHASHVTMSVNKLLQRVVTPDIRVRRRSLQISGSEQLASDLHAYTFGITSDPLTQFAVVFAALIHDVDHWGVSNEQLISEGVPIAARYGNKSIAEQNSVDLAWDLLMNTEEYGDLHRCIFPTDSEYKRFRQVVVNVVMATDIFDRELGELRKNRWAKAFQEDNFGDRDPDYENRRATIVIEHIMQASDIAHAMQHWHVYQKWNRRLFDEMYTAFRAGRMERDPAGFWYEGELKFFDNYVIPLANKLKECGVFGVASDECLNYATDNRREWEGKGPMIVKELVANYHARELEESHHREKPAEACNGDKMMRRKRMMRRRSLYTSGG